ncbi:MAG: hypothetical protein K6A30_00870 [Lachnospiraceae bacterium]|nr:hypothetical protein [Lachnospiraceae bacterium]
MDVNQIKELVLSFIPWMVLGITVALVYARFQRQEKEKEGEIVSQPKTYGAEGLCVGVLVGSVVGHFVPLDYRLVSLITMGIGLVVGLLVKRRENPAKSQNKSLDPYKKKRKK